MTNSDSPKVLDGKEFDMTQTPEWRFIVSISLQKAGIPHASHCVHLASVDDGLLTEDQITHALNTIMGVFSMCGVSPYAKQNVQEIKKLFEEMVAKGMVDKDGNSIMPQPVSSGRMNLN